MSENPKCKKCGGDLRYIPPYEPYSDEYVICETCDSTYNLWEFETTKMSCVNYEKDQIEEVKLGLTEYQHEALKNKVYGYGVTINYPILGLLGEAGELANKYKKVLRDDNGVLSDAKRGAILDELGDVLWYCAALADDLGETLGNIAAANIVKLTSRRERGVLQGSGDTR